MTIKQSDLFTELTPEQSAAVEGGAALVIHDLTAIKSGESGFFSKTDDPYILVNSKRLRFKRSNVRVGVAQTVNEVTDFTRRATVQIMDEDPGSDDRRARFLITDTGSNKVLRNSTRSGGGSIYNMTYSVLTRFQ